MKLALKQTPVLKNLDISYFWKAPKTFENGGRSSKEIKLRNKQFSDENLRFSQKVTDLLPQPRIELMQ